jgi:hypothetical protein
MIWREKKTLLIVLGLILLANTVFFFTYRVQYQSRLDALDERLDAAKRDLALARDARIRAERSYQSYRQVEKDVLRVFNEHWSTRPERLTIMIAEVKRLAVASNLVPTVYGFSRAEAKKIPGARPGSDTLGAHEVGITFNVKGSYEQVRRLINLLELSRQFVIISRINLSGSDTDELTLSLDLKTLFRDQPAGLTSNRL